MTSVLVTHSNCLRRDAKQTRKMRPYPPLATLYVAAALRRAGLAVALYDTTFRDPDVDFGDELSRARPEFVVTCEDSFNPISKMCLKHLEQTCRGLCETGRSYGARTIVTGPDATSEPEKYLRAGADFVVPGEPDITVLELVQALVERPDSAPEAVSGVAYLDDASELRVTPPRPPTVDLDSLPIPAWDLVDIAPYRRAWESAHGRLSVNLAASRGCPYACVWCAKPVWGAGFAMRSAEAVVDEIGFVARECGAEHIWFTDDVFGISVDWLSEFERLVGGADARLPYTMQTRADLMSDSAVGHLARSGCQEVWVGAESGSQRVLDDMRKGIRVDDVGLAVERLQAAGIRACLFLQFGFPGETFDDIETTVGMVRRPMPDDIGVSVTYPLPGSPLYSSLRDEMGEKANWDDSEDMAMLFRGRYGTAFYRQLHDVLHDDLDLRHLIRRDPTGEEWPKDLDRVATGWLELGRLARPSTGGDGT